jgi:hypothetical protein
MGATAAGIAVSAEGEIGEDEAVSVMGTPLF